MNNDITHVIPISKLEIIPDPLDPTNRPIKPVIKVLKNGKLSIKIYINALRDLNSQPFY